MHVPPRIYRRVPFKTAVRLQFDRFRGFIEEYSANLSLGGMFIATEEPLPIGSLVPIEFRLGEDYELIKGTGRVVWVRSEAIDEENPVGMGLRFAELTPGSRELIFRMVERRVREGGVPFDVEQPADLLPGRSPEPGPAPEGEITPRSPLDPSTPRPSPAGQVPRADGRRNTTPFSVEDDRPRAAPATPKRPHFDLPGDAAPAPPPPRIGPDDETVDRAAEAAVEPPASSPLLDDASFGDVEVSEIGDAGPTESAEESAKLAAAVAAAERPSYETRFQPLHEVADDSREETAATAPDEPSFADGVSYEPSFEAPEEALDEAPDAAPDAAPEEAPDAAPSFTSPYAAAGSPSEAEPEPAGEDSYAGYSPASYQPPGSGAAVAAEARPAWRRWLLYGVPLLVVLAAGAWVVQQRYLGDDGAPTEPALERPAAGEAATSGAADRTPADGAASDRTASEGASDDGESGTAGEGGGRRASGLGIGDVVAAEPTPADSGPDTGPDSGSDTGPDGDPFGPVALPGGETAGEAGSISEITWSAEGSRTVFMIWLGGPVSRGDVLDFRIDGENPRQVVRIVGIDRPYNRGEMSVGTRQVRRLRAGLHSERTPSELHLVFDLTGANVKLSDLQVNGNRVRIVIEGGR